MVVTCPEAFLPSSAEKSKKRDEQQSVEQRQRLLRWRKMKIMWCFCIIRYTDCRHGGPVYAWGVQQDVTRRVRVLPVGPHILGRSRSLSLLPFALWFGPTCLWNGSCRAQGESLGWWATSVSFFLSTFSLSVFISVSLSRYSVSPHILFPSSFVFCFRSIYFSSLFISHFLSSIAAVRVLLTRRIEIENVIHARQSN